MWSTYPVECFFSTIKIKQIHMKYSLTLYVLHFYQNQFFNQLPQVGTIPWVLENQRSLNIISNSYKDDNDLQIFIKFPFILPGIIIKFILWINTGSAKYPLFSENALKKLLNIFSNFFLYLKVQSFGLIMKNNFIQMAASAGHVGYCITRFVKFLSTLSIVCSCVSPMALRILWW